MNTTLKILYFIFLLVLVGCQQHEGNVEVNSLPAAPLKHQTKEPELEEEVPGQLQKIEATRDIRLEHLADVDDVARTVDGVGVHGSALTDSHVSAIRELTDQFAEIYNDSDSDDIVHDGETSCHRIWRMDGNTWVLNLKLDNGEWDVVSLSGCTAIKCNFGDEAENAVDYEEFRRRQEELTSPLQLDPKDAG